ncbi:MAG: hypothetical protein HY966_05395, partial [Ignavibacteriales bacterium]|nr:hypothetical protein [Ignavibacteriales bacterium]
MQEITEIGNSVRNQLLEQDRAIHAWYQFVLGYPPHLVRYYLNKFNVEKGMSVLDPFCGMGTTNVECKKTGFHSVGIEANPIAHLASKVKTNWNIEPIHIDHHLAEVIDLALAGFEKFDLEEPTEFFLNQKPVRRFELPPPELSPEQREILPSGFISDRPLRKLLLLGQCIQTIERTDIRELFLVALASVAIHDASNVAFGPEIYATKPKADTMVLTPFMLLVE